MEFIDGVSDGVSIEDLCEREDESGRLHPYADPQPLYDIDDESSEHGILDMSDESRLKILAYILECFVRGFRCGIKYEDYYLEDFIITDIRKGKKAWRPHVIKVNHSHCRVWQATCKGKDPQRQRKSDNQRLPRPVHPADHFTIRDLCDFTGWSPYEWWHDEAKFEAWLLEAFGPKIEYNGHRFQRFSLIAIRFSDLSE
ncbi:hypothetical protein CGLO_00384 [Colletotrichum gloeosporioides Cg-14]|uniref:Uncharacterized protein n=1 Tax=Colletotrichum gloeosporioides (strain Cg-14) TaxID=1237896 RepID=T0L424_COLGC|nr:hypothetical protein CGLO_00384 [Colletotrichum gloeosporioides Cg-14]